MIFYTLAVCFIALGLWWLLRVVLALKWVASNKCIGEVDKKRKVFAVIPVLAETKRIEATVDYFRKSFGHIKNFKIVLVSTESEYAIHAAETKKLLETAKNKREADSINNRENTVDICKRLKKSGIMHYHYPKAGKKMAHQLNFAIKDIIRKNGDCLFAVYNADSRPDKKTFDWVLSKKGYNVFQQYGNYFNNTDELNKSNVLWSAASWQTRWALGFEINHALRQMKFIKRNIPFKSTLYPMNYCIGHGLFFTTKIFRKLKGFSENIHNEDAIFGLELSYLNEPIMPIPYFDKSDSPNSLKALFIQKSTWFFGPLQSFNYMKIIAKNRKIPINFSLFVQSLKLFSHAVYWMAGPALITLSLILAIASLEWPKVLLWIIAYSSFFVLPNLLSELALNKHKGVKTFIRISLGGLVCYIMHGLSAYKTLLDITINKAFKTTVEKKRTPI
ncbi:MAG: glycosyltransferase family 2 protein [Candidatus Woesearchaeota archaeon]